MKYLFISAPIPSHPFSGSPVAPSHPHSARVPVPIGSARPCGAGAGRRFNDAMWMHGYPTVRGSKVDVMFVSYRRQLKYIIKKIYITTPTPATAASQGGRWQPTLWIYVNLEPPRTRVH